MMAMAGWGDLELVIGYAECSAEHTAVTQATIMTEPPPTTTAVPSGTSHDI